jgi:hypothetical protein
MIELFLLAQLNSGMSCQEVREVAEVVTEDPYLSQKDKKKILSNLFRNFMRYECLRSSES